MLIAPFYFFKSRKAYLNFQIRKSIFKFSNPEKYIKMFKHKLYIIFLHRNDCWYISFLYFRKIYILSRTTLLCSLCHEIPCTTNLQYTYMNISHHFLNIWLKKVLKHSHDFSSSRIWSIVAKCIMYFVFDSGKASFNHGSLLISLGVLYVVGKNLKLIRCFYFFN